MVMESSPIGKGGYGMSLNRTRLTASTTATAARERSQHLGSPRPSTRADATEIVVSGSADASSDGEALTPESSASR